MPTKRSHTRKAPTPSRITLAPVPKPKKMTSKDVTEMERQPKEDWEHLENPPITACGLNEVGIDHFINAAEAQDRGLTRHPWPAKLKVKIKAALNGKATVDEMKTILNKMVVDALGGGLHARGPLV